MDAVSAPLPATGGTGVTTRAREADRGRGDRGDRGVKADDAVAEAFFGIVVRERARRAIGEADIAQFFQRPDWQCTRHRRARASPEPSEFEFFDWAPL
jgi:hypothetical protein